ncbi:MULTISPECIES: DUF6183 family protein [unclassified Kitasatospora]|uniref:DUF6183 family protein n=1 Tax=unclassified Kitasatospora TaxID=2633591 RepID=UPI0007101BD4|nr:MULTISPECIES: DUF6183 family protein [unclassified Kitasatospora]KQV19234.1 hypothetical protein ASC99_24070 [Kitasatospora sp. Root107]KRB77510.1 hypothetical protein ASE03_00270 [Kitasatospora sp. Root187]
MNKDQACTVAVLSTAAHVEVVALHHEIGLRVSAGDFDWVVGLGADIAGQAAAEGGPSVNHDAVLGHIRRSLAGCSGPESLRALLRTPMSLSLEGPQRLLAERALAELIARGQRAEDIEQVVYGEQAHAVHPREFRACLLHELVLTGAQVEDSPALLAFARELVSEGHPLAELPLHLLPEEQGLIRPDGTAPGWTWTVSPLDGAVHSAAELHVTPLMRDRTASIEMTEISVPATAEVMGSAVRHWCTDSNGLIAAQDFWSPDPVRPEDFPAVFARLPLAPWEEGRARLHPSTSDEVFRILFTAARRTSAYGPSQFGSYGRLATWRSLAGLTEAPAGAPVERIAELVRQSHWFRPEPDSAWFCEVAWDLAVAVLRPGGQGIAVLAATDTD